MKALLLICLLAIGISIQAQVAVNTDGTAPDNSAMLDVKSITKGFLPPRMTLAQRNAISTPANGLMIYQTDNTPGYYYNSGSSASPVWVMVGSGSGTGSGWLLNGNSGTSPATNFIGTTDNTPLSFRVNNQKAGRIDHLLYNTSFGYQTLNLNPTGSGNTAIGNQALYSNTTGSANTASGNKALYSNTTGNDNTASGSLALVFNTTGYDNTASGSMALYSNTTGFNNTSHGSTALFCNTTGYENTASGNDALYFNTAGYNNTASGYMALYSNATGNDNTASGSLALYSNTTGIYNTASGSGALAFNTTGYENTASGGLALYSNTTGLYNTANGSGALEFNTTGYENTASGSKALYSNTTGLCNTASGSWALAFNTTGNWMTGLGHGADASADVTNSTVIGDAALVNASNKVRIGDGSMTVIEGQVAWSYPSDGRFKFNESDEVKGIEFIKLLRPVVYNFDTRKYTEFLTKNMPAEKRNKYLNQKDFGPSTAIRQSGFDAQEVVEAANRVGYNFNGVHVPESADDNYSIAYSQFVVPLVKAVQEQQSLIEEQQKKIVELQNTNAGLLLRVEKLEEK